MTARAVRFHPDARGDVRLAAAWYEQKRPALGTAFVADLQRVIQRIEQFPLSHPLAHGEYRRAAFSHFPYSLVFAACGDEELVIVAVFHQRRNPEAFAEPVW